MRLLRENLLVQFSVVSFLTMIVIAMVFMLLIANMIRSQAVGAVVDEAIADVSGRLLKVVTPADLETPMTGERYDRFARFVQDSIVSERTARVKLWAKDGTVIYSDDSASVGQAFPDNENLRKALHGENAAEIKIAENPENEQERFLGTLIEVYTPVIFPGTTEAQGVFEIYQYYQPTAELIANMQRQVLLVTVAMFLLLYGAGVGIVWGGWRTILRQKQEYQQAQDELSTLYTELKAFNLELEERVKERTEQLEEATQAAETASRAKSDFLASMSHELRTPLNAVIGFSQVLKEQYFGQLNEKQAEYITDILESGQHLLSLINDILDLAKIEAGKVELELSSLRIKDLLERSLVMVKEKALAHRIALEIQTTAELDGLEIRADERRLKQVMFNLLSNAAKFTPDGGAITVEGRQEGKELIISVTDTGIGIAPQEQAKIFEGFYQVKGGTSDKTPGTGLGLNVSRRIVEMHGGRIWVESDGPGRGSRFAFTLPI